MGMLQEASKRQQPPTDEQTMGLLRSLFDSGRANTSKDTSNGNDKSTTEDDMSRAGGIFADVLKSPTADNTRPDAKGKPATWASLFKTSTAAKKPAPKLWAPAWQAKVTEVAGMASFKDKEALVISVTTADGWQEAEIRATNREGVDTTLVWVGAEGATENVLVETAKGPVMAKAKVHRCGPEPPEMVQWQPDSELDDRKSETEVSLVTMRLTIVKEFADGELFARAKKQAHVLPATLLPESACAVILRTKAIAVYDRDVTCLLTVRTDKKDELEKAARPKGVVLAEHKNKSDRSTDAPPRWLVRPADSTPDEYWDIAAKAAKDGNGTVAYRPGGGSCLGAFGSVAREAVLPPKWSITGAPKHWAKADATAWTEVRGFSNTSGVWQLGQAEWVFRGWPPAKAENAKVLSFSSGIVLAAASPGKAKAQKVVASAKASFGPPREDKVKATTKQGDSKPMEVDAKIVAMPGAELFDVVECGGQGDCAYVSIGAGLAHKSKEKADAKDLQPGSQVQAQLRC